MSCRPCSSASTLFTSSGRASTYDVYLPRVARELRSTSVYRRVLMRCGGSSSMWRNVGQSHLLCSRASHICHHGTQRLLLFARFRIETTCPVLWTFFLPDTLTLPLRVSGELPDGIGQLRFYLMYNRTDCGELRECCRNPRALAAVALAFDVFKQLSVFGQSTNTGGQESPSVGRPEVQRVVRCTPAR